MGVIRIWKQMLIRGINEVNTKDVLHHMLEKVKSVFAHLSSKLLPDSQYPLAVQQRAEDVN